LSCLNEINLEQHLYLDEIQATPHEIQALRYFYETEPGLPVISAGSLLEFALADLNFSMPVGRIEYYHLGPMTFKEFLTAVEPSLVSHLSQFHVNRPVTAHQKLLNRQREYLFVGGMPEAVDVFCPGKKSDGNYRHSQVNCRDISG
jgi:uncharacterized protein